MKTINLISETVKIVFLSLMVLTNGLVLAQEKCDKIEICHIPPGNPGNPQTITISINALSAHLAHGDHIGSCVEVPPLCHPEINIIQGSTTIPDNTGIYNFGSVNIGTSKIITFTIQNTGSAILKLTGTPRIKVSGTGFSLTSNANSSIAAGTNSNFSITFLPNAAGTFSGTVSVSNNDSDENPYNFTLSGTGIAVVIPVISISIAFGTNPMCKSLQSVTFKANPVNAGTTPDYQWKINGNNAGSNSSTFTSSTLTNKDVVTCDLISSDPNASPATASSNSITMVINENPTPIVSATSIKCKGGNSVATVTGSGGTVPYSGIGTYTVIAGAYDYTITDANNCSATTSITITEPSVLTVNSTATDILCNGGTSNVTVIANGGTGNYTGTGTFTAKAGAYDYTITDESNCSATTSINVLEPALLIIKITATNITCNSSNNGAVNTSPTGGTSPYSYLWSNTFFGSTISNLVAGSYSVTVTDINGCSINGNANVVWTGPCDTKVRSVDCGTTVSTLSKYIYCDPVSGATDYEWEFTTKEFSFTKTRGSANSGFYMLWITGIQYKTAYDVRVRAYKNGVWGKFSSVCKVNTPVIPSSKPTSEFCETTVANLTQYVYCDAVALATDYEWTFTNNEGISFTQTREQASNSMSLSWIEGLEYNKIYGIKVRVQVGSEWGEYGLGCNISTPPIPKTQLLSFCNGTTVTSFSEYFYCDEVSRASDYEWTFTENGNSTTIVREVSSVGNSMNFSFGAKFNTTYSVKVRAKAGMNWGEFGMIYQISTPDFTTQVRKDICETSVNSLIQYIYCDKIEEANDYEWSFINVADNFLFTKTRGSSGTDMNLSWITGITGGKTYDVTIRININGQWSNFGSVCQIKTPSVVKLQNNDANEESKLEIRGSNLEAGISNLQHPASKHEDRGSKLKLPASSLQLSLMPNPTKINSSFTITLKADVCLNGTIINIFDLIGRIVYTQRISINTNEYLMNIEQNNKFNSGLFIIQVELNGEVYRTKLIVE